MTRCKYDGSVESMKSKSLKGSGPQTLHVDGDLTVYDFAAGEKATVSGACQVVLRPALTRVGTDVVLIIPHGVDPKTCQTGIVFEYWDANCADHVTEGRLDPRNIKDPLKS